MPICMNKQIVYKGTPFFQSRLWKTVLQEENLKCDEGDGVSFLQSFLFLEVKCQDFLALAD